MAREMGRIEGARPYFQGTVQLAAFTYQSIRFLCADKPENPARKLEFAVAVPPLARTILDSVFNPGQMPAQTTGWRQDYLRYLNDWFYRGLSAESHLSLNGFGKRAGFLFAPSPADH